MYIYTYTYIHTYIHIYIYNDNNGSGLTALNDSWCQITTGQPLKTVKTTVSIIFQAAAQYLALQTTASSVSYKVRQIKVRQRKARQIEERSKACISCMYS